jgi:hypothetical protein
MAKLMLKYMIFDIDKILPNYLPKNLQKDNLDFILDRK